ncbi:DUF4055 domain-containing protein [Synechococcus sp. 1G10]|uniref:DUF4055 domain-containing protein n=1 Tax=Synechococcus sp. 1G10 TaxID=2025605 RepID=UPI001E28B23D|nr:DUF4055 domain-containing protein [Synechococcus sp. 1G10]
MASRSRTRTRNKWLPLSPAEQQARASAKRTPLLQPWREHDTLRGLRDRLQLAFDCWNLLDAPDGTSRRSVYLPPGVKEPDSSYRNRIENARPTGFYRDALRTYAGMLSFLHWQALPHSLQAVIGDVDGRGTDLGVFLFIADLLVLRDGGCLILVLPPEHRWPSEGHRLDALRRGDRLSLPRLALVPRADFLDWQLPNPNGLPVRVAWRVDVHNPIRPDHFGGVPVHYLTPNNTPAYDLSNWTYRVAELAADGLRFQAYRAVSCSSAPSGYQAEALGPAVLLEGQHTMPCVWYAADGAAFGEGDLPHLGLANQYLTHYRLKSEYEDLLSRCALPVGVRSGLVDQYGFQRSEDGEPRAPEQLVLSTSTFMDLPEGADFNWKEIRARSLAEHRAYLAFLDETMRRDALVPTQNRGPGKSEQEVSLTAGQAYALLQSLATQKTSVFSTLLEHWCRATGDVLQQGAGVSLIVTPLTPPPRPLPSVGEWLTLHERGVISTDELRHQLALAASPGLVTPIGSSSTDSFAASAPEAT